MGFHDPQKTSSDHQQSSHSSICLAPAEAAIVQLPNSGYFRSVEKVVVIQPIKNKWRKQVEETIGIIWYNNT